jgi:DUF4097 and DUF4098 domain-containing protein YvlB
MKRLALVLIFVAASASAGTLEQNFDKTYDVHPGSTISLGNTNGRIHVKSWDQPRVRIQAVRRAESRDNDTLKQAMSQLRIEVSQAPNALRIATIYPKKNDGGLFDWIAGTNVSLSVTYELTVPRQSNLDIEDTNGGLDIDDIQGSLKLETTNGRIEIDHCAGDIDAETTNGGITAELLSLNAGKTIRLETTNGGIHVRLPRSAALALDAANTNGSIETDLPVQATSSGRKHSLRGTINGGGSKLRLRTTNGGITISASK